MRRFSYVTCFVLAVGLAACNKGQDQAQTQAAQDEAANVTSGNPQDGNLAPTSQGTPPVSPSGESYAPPPEYEQNYAQNYDQSADYEQPVEAPEPPPPLPDYEQPPCPGRDYVWTPGYWDYSNAGYYWVPGAWVLAPYIGALWTPPWWGYDNGVYLWHAGYWAPHIGFYGGIDYGFGYTGRGYFGGYWNHGHMDYNRAVTNIDTAVVHNVYNYSIPNRAPGRVSYNGGRGGINVRPTAPELAVQREARTAPVAAQVQHARQAAGNRAQFVRPGTAARPASVVVSKPLATSYHAPAARAPAVRYPAVQPLAAPSNVAPRVAERPVPQPAQRGPVQATRQVTPQPGQRPESRPQARPEARPQARPEARPAAPVQANRVPPNGALARRPPEPAPAARPQARPVPPPQARPEARRAPVQPQPRPQVQPQARPAPAPRGPVQARVQPRPAPARPAPQARPAPAPHPEEPRKKDASRSVGRDSRR